MHNCHASKEFLLLAKKYSNIELFKTAISSIWIVKTTNWTTTQFQTKPKKRRKRLKSNRYLQTLRFTFTRIFFEKDQISKSQRSKYDLIGLLGQIFIRFTTLVEHCRRFAIVFVGPKTRFGVIAETDELRTPCNCTKCRSSNGMCVCVCFFVVYVRVITFFSASLVVFNCGNVDFFYSMFCRFGRFGGKYRFECDYGDDYYFLIILDDFDIFFDIYIDIIWWKLSFIYRYSFEII